MEAVERGGEFQFFVHLELRRLREILNAQV
jgi:hypothetical protein